jgi:hypothetical protein
MAVGIFPAAFSFIRGAGARLEAYPFLSPGCLYVNE